MDIQTDGQIVINTWKETRVGPDTGYPVPAGYLANVRYPANSRYPALKISRISGPTIIETHTQKYRQTYGQIDIKTWKETHIEINRQTDRWTY